MIRRPSSYGCGHWSEEPFTGAILWAQPGIGHVEPLPIVECKLVVAVGRWLALAIGVPRQPQGDRHHLGRIPPEGMAGCARNAWPYFSGRFAPQYALALRTAVNASAHASWWLIFKCPLVAGFQVSAEDRVIGFKRSPHTTCPAT